MATFGEIFHDLIVTRLSQMYEAAVEFGPKIVLAAIIFLIGWVCAILLRKIASKLVKAVGVDVISEKAGLCLFLEKGGVHRRPSSLIGLLLYWVIIFGALAMVFDTLELTAAVQLMYRIAASVPQFIVALVLLSVGIFLSQFAGTLAETAARMAHVYFYRMVGSSIRFLVMAVAVMVCLEYIGVGRTSIIIIFGAVPLIACLAVIVGGREIVASMMAGRFLRKEYTPGDTIEFDSVSGAIQSMDAVFTKIAVKDGEVIIPHAELARKTIKRAG